MAAAGIIADKRGYTLYTDLHSAELDSVPLTKAGCKAEARVYGIRYMEQVTGDGWRTATDWMTVDMDTELVLLVNS